MPTAIIIFTEVIIIAIIMGLALFELKFPDTWFLIICHFNANLSGWGLMFITVTATCISSVTATDIV